MVTDASGRPGRSLSRLGATACLLLVALVLIGGAAIKLKPDPCCHSFHDELHYAQQARDIAEGGFPRYNRDFAPKYPPLYGAALAPVRAAAGRDGFAWWARFFNVVLAISALFPAYRLARLTLPRGWAVTAAVLSLLGAFQVYTRLLLSESLFTPLMLWCTLALVRACRRPTAGRALTAGLLLGFATLTKSLVIVMSPAVVIAVFWSLRTLGPAIRVCVGIGAGAALPLALWRFRGVTFPSERNLQEVFSYWNEFKAAGLLGPSDYIYWTRVELAAWAAAIAAPALVLAMAGLMTRLRDRRPANRSFAMFTLLSSLGVTAFTGIWMTQIAFYKAMVHERYLVSLWPLVTIAFVDRLARPGGGKLVMGLSVAVVVALILIVPADAFDPAVNYGYFVDFPAAEQAYRFWNLAGGANGLRVILLLPLLGLPLLLLRKRAIGVTVVLALCIGFAASGTHAVYNKLKQADEYVQNIEQPALDWLATRWRPGDGIICHGFMWNVHYRLCLMFDLPYSRVDPAGGPIWETAVALDKQRGVYRFRGRQPAGRILFLTRDPLVAPGRELSSFGDFRLIVLEDGKVPEGLEISAKLP